MVPLIRGLVLTLSLLLANLALATDVGLRASWTKGKEHWLIHIQIAPAGFFIAPNSPAFDNDQLIQVTDAATRQPIGFRLRPEKQRTIRSIDLAFPQLQRPVNVFVSVGGLFVVDQKGSRVAYQQSVIARAPARETELVWVNPDTRKYHKGGSRFYGSLRTGKYMTESEAIKQGYKPAKGEETEAQPSPTPWHDFYHTFSYEADSDPQKVGPSNRRTDPRVGPPQFPSPQDDWIGPPVEAGQGAPPLTGKEIVAEAPPDAEIPQFPFPPPQASAFDTVPRELLVAGKPRPKLKDVDATLSAAFRNCGYGEKSFYAVPDGFAMASRLEQINADGSFGANRWSLETAAMSSFSIESYLKALFQAREGHFRVVVFVVTNHPFEQTDAQVSSDEAKNWVKRGLNDLPKQIGDRDFSGDYVCTALIYEFKTLGGGEAKFVEPSEITGHMHLEKSGLLSALAQPR